MVYTPGPFASEHGYLNFGGSLPGGESWTCGLRLAPLTGVDSDLDTWNFPAKLALYVPIVKTMFASAVDLSYTAKLQYVKFNRISRTGHYTDPTTNEAIFADVTGAIGGTGVPNQIALAVSLTTGLGRGPAHEGRFFLPLPAIAVSGDGRMSTAYCDGAAADLKTFINALNAIAEGATTGPTVCVMSRKAGAPATHAVTGVKVGRVLDTQRRRRRSLAEGYSTVSLGS